METQLNVTRSQVSHKKDFSLKKLVLDQPSWYLVKTIKITDALISTPLGHILVLFTLSQCVHPTEFVQEIFKSNYCVVSIPFPQVIPKVSQL